MNKKIIILIVILSILLGVGGYFYYKNFMKQGINVPQPSGKSTPKKEATFSGTIKDLPKPPVIEKGGSIRGTGNPPLPPQ